MKCRRWLRLKTIRLMRLRGDPDLIAKGIAIGVSVDFLPTFGFGVFIAYLFATIGRVNQLAAVIASLALSWMILPFYGANLIIGRLFLGKPTEQIQMPEASFFTLGTIKNLSDAFFLGSVVNALVGGLVTYFLARCLIEARRARREKRK